MYAISTEEATGNERLRQSPKRRCSGCGTRLNSYAADSRVLCTLCLAHDTEARLICSRRLLVGRRASADPEQLAGIEANALHAALWRLAEAELAEDFRAVPAGGSGGYTEVLTEKPRRLVASRERIRGIWYSDSEQRHDPAAFLALREEGYLQHIGYAAWDSVCTLWEVWNLYPRAYDPLGDR